VAAAVLAVAPPAAALAAAGVLFHRGLSLPPSFDEGVYLAQTDALLHGQRLGEDVFAAQPPGFHWLLLAAAKVGGLGVDQLRYEVLALALLGLVAAYLVGRAVGGPVAGLVAAAVLAVAPPYPTFAAQISADLPGTVLALLALACLLAPGRRRWLFVLGGVLFAAAEWVKLDAFILLLPVLAYAAARRLRPGDLLAAAGAALVASGIAAAVLAGALPDVWRGAVSYHLSARGAPGHHENVHALRAFFDLRQPFTWLVAAALAAYAVLRPRCRLPLWPLWATAAASALFLLWHRPLHDNHMVLLSLALVVPVGASLAAVTARFRLVAAAALALLVAAGYVQETRRLDRNAASLPAELAWEVGRVEAHSTPGQLVVSDEPIVPVLAHRRMPGEVIDTAVLRFDSGYLSNADVLRAIDSHRVPVVVAGRSFLLRPALLAEIAKRFPPPQVRDGVRVYVRSA
ncbi:MAG TPA: glycosyltransferase family 39 protein, partial [Gaiellaceae bacterium]